MIQKKKSNVVIKESKSWILYATGSAVFASLTSILGKIGIENVNSNLGTAIRTVVILIMAWIVVLVTGKLNTIVFSYFVFKEKLNIKSGLGLVLIVEGTLTLLL